MENLTEEQINGKLILDIAEITEAVDNFGYLEDEILDEGLVVSLKRDDFLNIESITLSKLLNNFSSKEIKDEIKDKDNGKVVSDYIIPEEDKFLSINKMYRYIVENGTSDDKDSVKEKLDSLRNREKKVDRTEHDSKKTFSVGYGTIKAFYNIYKKVRNKKEKSLTEDVSIMNCDEKDITCNENTVKDYRILKETDNLAKILED